ncbi:MAG: dTDP-4-dehydrorhamnose reductase [Thermodesulfobacteriota bacterium]
MKTLIIGSNGQLGWELVRQGNLMGLPLRAVDFPDIDITRPDSVVEWITGDTNLVVNAAAYTAVDRAESERELAFAVNHAGPEYLSVACARHHIPLIHISTDYVFDGTRQAPYRESDPVAPMGVYGKSKSAGEAAVRAGLKRHVIVRTAWLCGEHGQNFVKTMLRLCREKETLRVVNDQHGCPTFAFDLAEAILKIVRDILSGKTDAWGTYHYCGRGETTWYGFTREIVRLAKEHTDLKVHTLEPITTEEYPTPARRPRYSVLDCHRIEETFGIINKPWQDGLDRLIRRLFAAENR